MYIHYNTESSVPLGSIETSISAFGGLHSLPTKAMCPYKESNLDLKFRKLTFYPLNYGGIMRRAGISRRFGRDPDCNVGALNYRNNLGRYPLHVLDGKITGQYYNLLILDFSTPF